MPDKAETNAATKADWLRSATRRRLAKRASVRRAQLTRSAGWYDICTGAAYW